LLPGQDFQMGNFLLWSGRNQSCKWQNGLFKICNLTVSLGKPEGAGGIIPGIISTHHTVNSRLMGTLQLLRTPHYYRCGMNRRKVAPSIIDSGMELWTGCGPNCTFFVVWLLLQQTHLAIPGWFIQKILQKFICS